MVRIINHSILFFAWILFLTSCSKQVTDESLDVVDQLTRSLGISVLEGGTLPTHVGVYIENATYPAQSVANVLLTQKGNRYESAQSLSWGGTNANIGISAYAPYLAGVTTDETIFSVKLNQKSEADYLYSDLMWGREPEIVFGQGKLHLALAHLMVKLIVDINYVGASIDPTNYNIENLNLYGFYTAIPFFPKTGRLGSAYFQKEAIVPFGQGRHYEALVVPQSAMGFRHIEFDVRNKAGVVKRFASSPSNLPSADSILESGRAYKIIVEADFTNMSSTRQVSPMEVASQIVPCNWN